MALLNHAIQHRRNAELALTAPGLWNFDTQHRLRYVTTLNKLLSNPWPLTAEIGVEIFHRHPVDASDAPPLAITCFVAFNMFSRSITTDIKSRDFFALMSTASTTTHPVSIGL